jgi:hypothetical protein
MVHTTIPVHEVHHNKARHYAVSAVTMVDSKPKAEPKAAPSAAVRSVVMRSPASPELSDLLSAITETILLAAQALLVLRA